ncbi:Aste57867_9474 [Aphanomyces stellatus]|uniref:Sugar transporter SWEET1 n=1 Tax=Aphanomyces stellatus TaxID=120398 RepID=A0A485KMZ4_9STRA|nr:hypothetical protein As57867_009437 [Aphanomyces stellatus]VFT86353.1 Aste57867_9474 [Aphanomyces stellatus]
MTSAHHPAVINAVKLMASISAIYMNLSPMKDMTRVRANIPVDMLPILCMFMNGSMWTLYGVLVNNWFPLVATNAIGVVLSGYYLIVMYTHAGLHRGAAAKKILTVVALVVFAILYAAYGTRMQTPHVATHVGYAGIGVSSLMVASPLASVGAVFKHKSAASLPFTMISAGVACSFLWLSFGALINDMLVMAPNAVNLALGLFQLSLCFMYPGPQAKIEEAPVAPTEIELAKKTLSE